MKPLQFILTAVLLGSMMLTGCQSGGFRDWTETSSVQAFTTSLGAVTRTEATAESRDAVQQLRTYTDTAGCTVYMGRIQPQGAACEGQTAAQYVLTGAEGTVRSYSVETGQWSVTPLENKMSLGKGMYFVRTDQSEAVLVTPLTYTGRENGMIEYLPDYDGALSIQKTSDGYTLSLSVAALPGNSYGCSRPLDQLPLYRQQPLVLRRLLLHCSLRLLSQRGKLFSSPARCLYCGQDGARYRGTGQPRTWPCHD